MRKSKKDKILKAFCYLGIMYMNTLFETKKRFSEKTGGGNISRRFTYND